MFSLVTNLTFSIKFYLKDFKHIPAFSRTKLMRTDQSSTVKPKIMCYLLCLTNLYTIT